MSTFKAIIKYSVIAVGIILLIYIGITIYFAYSFASAFDMPYSRKDLVDNFNKRQQAIVELKIYFNRIVPKSKQVEIEFESDNKLFRFGVSPLDTVTGNVIYPIFLEWDLKTNSAKVDSVIATLGWTQETLKNLKEKLDSANCIRIESGEPVTIGFKRSGMGMYSYKLFTNPIPDSLKGHYNDSCRFIYYNERLVLEYGGGAIGGQCFPVE